MNKAVFIIISVIFLIWNLMGVGAFITELTAPEVMTEAMNEVQIEMYEQRPSWYLIFYGLAVFAGLLASIMLLARKKSAKLFALLSLLGVIVTTGYNTYSGAVETLAPADQFFFISVPILSVFLLVFARHATRKGMLR